MLDSFGIEKQQIRKGTTFEPRSDAYTFIEAETRHIHKPLVLFNLGSGDIKKTWAINHYLQLANYITERYDCHIGVFVNPGQEYLSEQLYALCQHNNIKQISLFKYKDFSHIAALMLKARYLITGDTGLMFIAFGVKLPIIGLFTHTHPDSVIAEDSPSIICYTESDTEKDENNKPYCTNNISVTEVKKAIDYIESDYKELGCFKRTFVRLNQD